MDNREISTLFVGVLIGLAISAIISTIDSFYGQQAVSVEVCRTATASETMDIKFSDLTMRFNIKLVFKSSEDTASQDSLQSKLLLAFKGHLAKAAETKAYSEVSQDIAPFFKEMVKKYMLEMYNQHNVVFEKIDVQSADEPNMNERRGKGIIAI